MTNINKHLLPFFINLLRLLTQLITLIRLVYIKWRIHSWRERKRERERKRNM